MTGPRIDPAPLSTRPMTGAEWAAAQSAPVSALQSADPSSATTSGLGRPLNGAEWSQSQRMSADQVTRWKIPALPMPTMRRDVTTTPADPTVRGKKIDTPIVGALMRQLVDPALEHPVQGAALAALLVPGVAPALAAAAPLATLAGGTFLGGSAAATIAQYGWQKYLEQDLSPDAKKEFQQDPDRVSGEAAAVQAAMLGLAPLIHVGSRATDVSGGMMEAGAAGVKDLNLGPRFTDGFSDGQSRARFAAMLERGSQEPVPTDLKVPKGFQPTEAPVTAGRGARPAEGLITAPTFKPPGKVKALETEPASAPLQTRAEIDAARRAYEAQRLTEDTQDVAAARLADAERVLGLRDEPQDMTPRRRPGGQKDGQKAAPYFESPQGAEVLGAMAARHGLPDDANPYHPASPLRPEWDAGHQSARESYPVLPDGFSMGGALTDNRIPPDFNPPKTPGFEPTALPEGVTPEAAQLAAALKPSRFRGHSTDELVQIARSAREQIDRAQAVVSSDTATPEATTAAERLVTRSSGTLAQAEREFAMRGITGDELAKRIGGDTPAAPAGTTANGLTPVEGTGTTRTRGLSAGVAQKALANRLELTVGDLPEYRQVSMREQADAASALIASDAAKALRVATGEEPAPRGLLPESVFVAVEQRAIEQGDVATLRELATSKLTTEATTMGQRIRALGERDPDSPVAAIQDVIKTRSGGNAEHVAQAVRGEVTTMQGHVDQPIEPTALVKFIDSLRC